MPSDVLTGVNVRVQPRSGFDKSRKNILTAKVGTITPILHDLIIPNTDVSIKMAIAASLPPLASETFMRASLKVEAFFVPLRLLYGGFESWLTGSEIYDASLNPYRAALPRLKVEGTNSTLFGPGTLLDYLGVQLTADTFSSASAQNQTIYFNIFPLLAYHRIYDDWYRNTKIQKPIFTRPGDFGVSSSSQVAAKLRAMPFVSFKNILDVSISSTFTDNVYLGSLRQRNFGSDYFTVATPSAQLGAPMTVTTNSSNQFSIAALRSANSIQQWEELQNLSGTRIQDFNKANYGARLSAGIAQRAVYLGSAEYPVYSKGVYANQGVTATNNPFTSVGARYGSAFASGTDFVVKGHFDEQGVLMINATLVPEANYTNRCIALMRKFIDSGSQVDIPNPMLQNIGNEEIMQNELDVEVDFSDASLIFGYVPRYTWHKTATNEVHGLLIKGSSLASFVAQRSFNAGTPTISSNFLRIPTTALDNVTAVTGQLSQYGCWIDSYIQYYCSMPLAKFLLPSLQNPAYEHGVSVHIENNGSKID